MTNFSSARNSRHAVLLNYSTYALLLRRVGLLCVFVFGLLSVAQAQSQTVFVNELRYDSYSLVNGEFQPVVPNLIEIAGPAETNVTSWSLVFYSRIPNVNGNVNEGRVYGSVSISGVIPNLENGYGVLAYTLDPNTLTDDEGGIAVVAPGGVVTNFISYEGVVMTAVDGPAAGLVAKRTPAMGSTNGNQSLQLQGTGSIYTDFTWSPLFTATPGAINKAFNNNDQIFVQPTFVNISVNPTTVTEGTTSNTAVITVTATRPVVGNQSVRVTGSGPNVTGDFGLSLLTIPIPAGTTSGTALLSISNDSDIEGTEILTLTIDNPSASVFIGPTNTATVTILDDDLPPALTVAPTSLNFNAVLGTASPEQSYVLSATALTSILEVRPPPAYEVSKTSGTGYQNVITFPNSTTSATVYVRLRANAPAGSNNGTIVNFSGSQTANVGVTGTVSSANQAPVATTNPNQVGTVGVNFSYQVNAFTDPNGDALTYTAQGLPAGLSFDASTRTISGVASTSGVSTVTITGIDPGNLSASTTFTISINAAPATNQPPVAVANANQTGTVGVNFQYTVNAFTDPNGDALTYSAAGLPGGLTFDASTRTISGIVSTSGVSTVTITATDPGGLSASTTFTITINATVVNPPVNQAPVATTNPNQTGTVGISFSYQVNAFTDPNNDALTYTAQGLPAGSSFDASTRTISGVPSTSGVSTVTITATDPGNLSASTTFQITINAAVINPPVSGSLQFLPPTYNCATGAFTFNTTGGDGSPITFMAIGIVGATTTSGSSLADDVDAGLAEEIRRQTATIEPVTLYAMQNGITVTYLWDARNACSGSNPNPNPPTPPTQGNCGSPANTVGQPLTLLQPTYDCASGIIRFNTTGGDGSPITYFGVGITAPTTNCVASVDRGNTDANTFTLSATQNGVTSTVTWVRPCAAARRAAREPSAQLNVSVLGNPVQGNVVQFEVRGAEGQAMRAKVVNGVGRVVSETGVLQSGAVERHALPLGESAGLYILQVSTPQQVRTVKVVKQ